jgi:hypothetical protein
MTIKKLSGYWVYSIIGICAGLTSIISTIIIGLLLVLAGANRYVLSGGLDVVSKIVWALMFLFLLVKKDSGGGAESKTIKVLLFALFFIFLQFI